MRKSSKPPVQRVLEERLKREGMKARRAEYKIQVMTKKGRDPEEVEEIKSFLSSVYEMIDKLLDYWNKRL